MYRSAKHVSAVAATLLLAACGGGGGGGESIPVQFETRKDVVRELGLVLGAGPISVLLDRSDLSPFSARAKAREACSYGGFSESNGGKRKRNFDLLSPPVKQIQTTVLQDDYEDCEYTEGFILSGRTELGLTSDDQRGNPRYFATGQGSVPYRETIIMQRTSGGVSTEVRDYRGLVEYVGLDDDEYAAIASYDFKWSDGTNTRTASAELGDATPFRAVYRSVGGERALKLDGIYSYSSSLQNCLGGRVRVSTPQPLKYLGSEIGRGIPGSGQLILASGSKTVTFDFQDGAATYRIEGAAPVSLSSEELNEVAYGGGGCHFLFRKP